MRRIVPDRRRAENAEKEPVLSTEASPIAETLADIRHAIARAEATGRRAPGSVTLVAVSKTVPAGGVEPALRAGQRVFGENRVQEAKAKWPALREQFDGVELHLLGPLQSNKTREAVELFDVIESVDRPKIARALADERDRMGRCPALLVEINTGEEPQKAGLLPHEADAMLRDWRETMALPISGLMCVPPAGEAAGPHFALLAKIAERNGLPLLSMGMSADFETGIMLGATHVRIGTAIFGARPRL
jgi:PLP dependent protein